MILFPLPFNAVIKSLSATLPAESFTGGITWILKGSLRDVFISLSALKGS
jgi:hypothetical protein